MVPNSPVLHFFHLLGLCIALGGPLFFNFILYPSLKFLPEKKERHLLLAQLIRYYHPFFLGGLCLIFLSGAFRLTDLKEGLGGSYFDQVGGLLMFKFGMTLLIFNTACMQAIGTGLKYGRMVMGVIPGDEATIDRYAKKIWRVSLINLLLIAGTVVGIFFISRR
ncbi:MAG: hypothetical protein HYS22_03480 [Deltaproteobacteria bacterium]|nr:hypothetical protein [Deltaproteobacteria bacterium]